MPEKTALRFDGTEISFARLEQRVAALAGWLKTRACQGERVAYLGWNSPELLELLFACSRIGATFVPLNARSPAEELTVFVGDCDPRLVVAEHAFADVATLAVAGHDGAELVLLAPGWAPGDGDPVACQPVRESAPVLLAYTSGTTGRPKGAVLTGQALFFNALNAVSALGITAADHVLTVLPMFHVGGLNILTTPAVLAGATITLEPRFDPKRTLEAIGRVRPTLTVLVPAASLAVIAHPAWTQTDVSSLRAMVTGSTVVAEAAVMPWLDRGVSVTQVYGLTETCPIASVVPLERSVQKHATAGLPAVFCELRIDRPLEADTGEVLIRGPNVMREYWHSPEATRDAFSDGWFRSGDLGYFDADGFLHVVDRLKDLIIVGGSNVYPADLERILDECEAIKEAAVVGRFDANLGELPVACVVLHEAHSMTASDVMALFDARIASYKHPRAVVFFKTLPRNALGKVQKQTLRDLVAQPQDEQLTRLSANSRADA